MRILLDSHVLLWALNDSDRIGSKATILLEDAANELFVSAASLWELSLKHAKGKLPYGTAELRRGIKLLAITTVPVTVEDISKIGLINLSHKDPFDTLLVAQSITQDMLFMTADTNILSSSHKTIDARL